MHILIVDDHAFVCAGLKATLLDTLDDIQVTTTERGEEVLSILGKEDIDLIILDLFMPGGFAHRRSIQCSHVSQCGMDYC